MPRILYKYLDINGAKCMIGNQKKQYARKKLNPQINLYQMRMDSNAF
jgi:hypothetical protein